MLEVRDLNIGFGKPLLEREVSFFINKGFTALIGRNGTGKTTFLKTISGHLKPLNGGCYLNNQSIHHISAELLATQVSIVNTERIRLSYLKVKELLALGRFPHTNFLGKLTSKDKDIIQRVIKDLSIEHLQEKNLHELSDGELQKILIGRAIVQDTPIVLLDEPTTHLDLVNRYQIFKLLKSLADEYNKIILLSTHEIELALQVADNLILINKKGELITAPKNDFIQNDFINKAFSLKGITFDNEALRFRFQ